METHKEFMEKVKEKIKEPTLAERTAKHFALSENIENHTHNLNKDTADNDGKERSFGGTNKSGIWDKENQEEEE